jgi:prepilin-type processing-associated H-X9-DG protein
VSILLPSLQRAKSLAKMVMCLQQMRVLSVGFSFYRNDFQGGPVGFRGWSSFRPDPDHDPFPSAQYAYTGWFSGKRIDAFGNTFWGIRPYLDDSGTAATYCTNHMGGNPGHSAGYAVNWERGQQTYLPDPERLSAAWNCPMLWCGTFIDPDANYIRFAYTCWPLNNKWGWGSRHGDWMVSGGEFVHDGSSNFLFIDGHAQNQPALDTPWQYYSLWEW